MRRLVLSILAAIVTAACSNGTESWLTPDLVSTAFRSESPAPPGRAVTLEDYYSIRRVGSPELSPAGDRASRSASHMKVRMWLLPAGPRRDYCATARKAPPGPWMSGIRIPGPAGSRRSPVAW